MFIPGKEFPSFPSLWVLKCPSPHELHLPQLRLQQYRISCRPLEQQRVIQMDTSESKKGLSLAIKHQTETQFPPVSPIIFLSLDIRGQKE